ncbi:MAG: cysteine dioxygenase family protein [Flavobacteriales bacterium]
MSAHLGNITTVDQLVRTLKTATGADDYFGMLDRLSLDASALLPFCRWNSRHYTRTSVARTDDFELLVICYEPGQRTSIHDYNSQAAWIHPISGDVLEERFAMQDDGLACTGSTVLKPGSFSALSNGQSIHRFTNTGNGLAITLNLYARPLKQWRVYNEITGRASVRSPNA